MNREQVIELLEGVKSGGVGIDEAVERLKNMPYADLGFAKIDHHRHLRRGFPEVVLCEGKTVEQVAEILANLYEGSSRTILATRATPGMFEATSERLRGEVTPEYNRHARTIVIRDERVEQRGKVGRILIITAGTSDIPVAEEAAITADIMGNRVERLFDVGVAGIHRLLKNRDMMEKARVIIVAAGMEGALASVVGGLVDKPVIGVPTSIGYGASFNGLAALLGMLNSCASGVAVVNIDNGFGAGYIANLINRTGENVT